ncbi:MAG: apolipoprotein A1/A4/E family protein [Clostridiales bacterium]|nr:apolipoprotein A1/A4/E family protein [Clostridiales bacterium]
MSKCINRDTGVSYLRINDGDYVSEDYFYPYPTEFIFIDLFFVSLLSSKGEYFLLLDFAGYIDPVNLENNKKSLFSVPYTTMPVLISKGSGIDRPSQYGTIWQEFHDFMKNKSNEIEAAEAQLRYGMGIQHWVTEKGDTYLEYKFSNTGRVQKCYCVREHFVSNVEEIGILNLKDPDCLFHHYYLPLKKSENYEWNKDNGQIIFLDKCIPENVVCQILRPAKLKKYAIAVDGINQDFSYDETDLYELDLFSPKRNYNIKRKSDGLSTFDNQKEKEQRSSGNSYSVNIYGAPSGLQIQQGTSDSMQTQHSIKQEVDYTELQNVLDKLSDYKSIFNQEFGERSDELELALEEATEAIKTQKVSNLQKALGSIKSIMEGAAGSFVATGVLTALSQIPHIFG